MSSPPTRHPESGIPLGHVASPPRRHEQHSTNNPTFHPEEHPQVYREYPPKYDKEQETQSPEGTHQSGVFVAEGHGAGAIPAGHGRTEPSSRAAGPGGGMEGGGIQGQSQEKQRHEGQEAAAEER